MTAYTLGQLTADTLEQLRGTTRDVINTLAEPLDAPAALTSQTIYFSASPNGVTIASVLVCGSETMYVQDVNTVGNSATVLRGFDGTTPVASAAGTLVWVDPPWPWNLVQNRIRDEIRSWPPQVWRPMAVDIPIVNMQRGYDLGAIVNSIADGGLGLVIIRILRVTAPQPPYVGSPGYWDIDEVGPASNTSLADPTFPFLYDKSANTSEFPSGASLTLVGPLLPTVNGNLHVAFATPFDVDTSWEDSTDMIGDVGMDERDLDIPGLGAAARLLRGMSVRRAMLNVAGQSRDDQNVTMATILQATQQFRNDCDKRLGDVQQRQYSDFPIRQSNY